MRIIIQRESEASVTINHEVKCTIAYGLLILLGIEAVDTPEDADWLCKKIVSLRIFPDEAGLMNKDITEMGGDIIVVSQFTLHAMYKKGNRPSFIRAAKPEQAIPLYEYFVKQLSTTLGKEVKTGTFGADMKVALVNDGPITITMDTQDKE
jgi:D-tyrosyl-tRNA(Tyr) deacylase